MDTNNFKTASVLWDLTSDLLDVLDSYNGTEWTTAWLYDRGNSIEEIRALGYDWSDEEFKRIIGEECISDD